MENEQDETTAKKDFTSLPAQLRELVLSKTDTDTRLKLFQINNEMREWVVKNELFGEDLKEIQIFYSRSKARIASRYGSHQEIDEVNQYVFKVARCCKRVTFDDDGCSLTSIFPTLQSIDDLKVGQTRFKGLSQMFMGNAIQLTGFCHLVLYDSDVDLLVRNNDGMFLQFMEDHLKRCKTVLFEYPLEKLFDFLRRRKFPQAIFRYYGFGLERFEFENDLKRILRNGIPGLHPDSAIWMVIDGFDIGENQAVCLSRLLRIISEKTDVVLKNEAVRNKFLVSYEKVGGSLTSDPYKECGSRQSINDSVIEFVGLKRKFEEKRNLIFLVYPTEGLEEINIHIKFDPIEQ